MSDPVSTMWVENRGIPRPQMWGLINYLLESSGLPEYVEAEIQAFFAINNGWAQATVIWDAFKPFV